ncbi:MAG: hypothetical protein NTV49_03910 [Kiritimatiellaeota bacterium]|nr:hypothetical protein [Kiritimatiellota bacterium]
MKLCSLGISYVLRAWLGAAAVAGCLTLPVLAAMEPAGKAGGATVAKTAADKAEAAKATAAKRERQAEIRKGLDMLERAKSWLQYKDAKDLAGHKEKTMNYVESAIKELRMALEADK